MPSIIQIALASETLLNIPAVISLCFFPSQTLNLFLASLPANPDLDDTTLFLTRCLGFLILGLTPPLLLAYPNSSDASCKRKMIYMTLGLCEGVLIPLYLWEALRATDQIKAGGAGGLSRSFCLAVAAISGMFLAWRVFVARFKPHWFGETGDVVEKAKKSR